MALALIGYFCTMVSALAVFMAVLCNVMSPTEIRQPHPVVVPLAQAAEAEKKPEQAAPVAPAPIQAVASREKADAALLKKRQQLARSLQKRKMAARQREERGYPTALAYGDEFPDGRGSFNRMLPPFMASRF